MGEKSLPPFFFPNICCRDRNQQESDASINDMLKYEQSIQVSSYIYAVSVLCSYIFFMWWIQSILEEKLFLLIRFWWLQICMMNSSLFFVVFFFPPFLAVDEEQLTTELNKWFFWVGGPQIVQVATVYLRTRSDFSGVSLELLGSTWAQMTLLSTGQTKLNHSSLKYKCIWCECVPSECFVLCDRSPAWIVPGYIYIHTHTHNCVAGGQTFSLKCTHSSKKQIALQTLFLVSELLHNSSNNIQISHIKGIIGSHTCKPWTKEKPILSGW